MGYISEDYCSEELSGILMEKGYIGAIKTYLGKDDINVKQITIQSAMKWLREVHNYDVSVCLDSYVEPYDNLYYIVIRRRKDKYENISPCEQAYYDTYEEAAEVAIKYCLENLI